MAMTVSILGGSEDILVIAEISTAKLSRVSKFRITDFRLSVFGDTTTFICMGRDARLRFYRRIGERRSVSELQIRQRDKMIGGRTPIKSGAVRGPLFSKFFPRSPPLGRWRITATVPKSARMPNERHRSRRNICRWQVTVWYEQQQAVLLHNQQ